MLPSKLRTAKVRAILGTSHGIQRWQAPTVARGVIRTALKWAAGQDEITLDDIDVQILRAAANELRDARPIVGWYPFRKGFCGSATTISTKRFRYLLGG